MSKIKPEPNQPFVVSDLQEAKKNEKYVIETYRFNLGDEKVTYFGTRWKPQDLERPKGLVFLCHGYAEYFSPSYDEISANLIENGFVVFGHDHVGHGRSSGQRVQVQTLDDYVLPVLQHCQKTRQDFGTDLPVFIIGHSMGGLITTYAALKDPDLFKGIVLIGPLIKMDPNIATPFKKMLAGWFKDILPSFTLGSLDPSGITRDESVVERVKNDDLCWHGGFRAHHSYVLLEVGWSISRIPSRYGK